LLDDYGIGVATGKEAMLPLENFNNVVGKADLLWKQIPKQDTYLQ
jgi:hypothetical protein